MEYLSEFFAEYGGLLAQGTIDTLVMTVVSCLFAYVIGLPVGVAFAVTTPNGLHPIRWLNTVLGWIINIGRSIPVVILLVAIVLLAGVLTTSVIVRRYEASLPVSEEIRRGTRDLEYR